MNRDQAFASLRRALDLSQLLWEAAGAGDIERVVSLDAERLGLLKSARQGLEPMNEKERSVLRAISELNARSLGRVEHRFRAKCRDMDMLAAGRRAVRAYLNAGS